MSHQLIDVINDYSAKVDYCLARMEERLIRCERYCDKPDKCCDDAIESMKNAVSIVLADQRNKLEAVDNSIKIDLAEAKRKLAEVTAALDVQRLTLVRYGQRIHRLETVGCSHSQDVAAPTIKPCPFCGGKAKFKNVPSWYWLGCVDCKVETETYPSEEEAIAIWNKRV